MHASRWSMRNWCNPFRYVKRISFCCAILSMLSTYPVAAEIAAEVTGLSIEQLMEQTVTTVSKTDQAFADSAAAVFVISEDDIRRSAASSVPELLRHVPGIHVAQIDASKWAITARGFNGRFANKLLVLVDGRAVYTTSFSGVYWETQDLLLEDIERIEVIRGPGASIWGANAVNGVINIITKKTEDTKQNLVSITSGNEERAIVGLRTGGDFGNWGSYRAYAKYANRDGQVSAIGEDAGDDWDFTRGGFRMDWSQDNNNAFTVQADVFDVDIEQNLSIPSSQTLIGTENIRDRSDTQGGSLVARWQRTASLASRMSAQVYLDAFDRDDAVKVEKRETIDLHFQHELALSRGHDLVWGVEYQTSKDEVGEAELVTISPAKGETNRFSAFVQDQRSLLENHLDVTLGVRLEHQTRQDWDYHPNISVMYKPHHNHRFWASVSRATRTPSRGETHGDIRLLYAAPLQSTVVLEGSPKFEPESLVSYQLGYRTWPNRKLQLDISAFYHAYDDLIYAQPNSIVAPGIIPLGIVNGEEANARGLEFTSDWRPSGWLRLQMTYSYWDANFQVKEAFKDQPPTFQDGDKRAPNQMFSLKSSINMPMNIEMDVWTRYVDSVPDTIAINPDLLPDVEGYVAVDLRLGWRKNSNLEFALVGRNLNDPAHLEYLQEIAAVPTQIQRHVFAQVKWTF